MATINLGAIKFNWKGAYSGATAYVVDDVVESSGSSYICIAATTGNAPPNATYWEQMSSAGTDGTDLTSTLTTQGDIVYRDASGLARLGAGTSGQVLQTNGTGANPSWGTVSSDFVKLASNSLNNSTNTGVNFESFIDNSTYSSYYLKVRNLVTSANNTTVRMLTGTNTEYTTSDYRCASNGRNSALDGFAETNTRWRFTAGYHANTSNTDRGCMLDFWFSADANKSATHNSQWCNPFYNNSADIVVFNSAGGISSTSQTWTGIRLYADGGDLYNYDAELYGIK